MTTQLFEIEQRGFTLRDFQAIDTDEVCRLWAAGNRRVLCVHATGLGKSLMGAELAIRKPPGTRALIVVDSTDLTRDLYDTVYKHTGRKPGILTGGYKEGWRDNDILIATKQCLCSSEAYRYIDWSEFDRVIVDECESGLANEYLLMLSHILEHPHINLCGMTATPLPAGKRKITDLFSHAATEPGPLYRDLQWAYLNGWLVKPMQGALRCSMDFASLKIRKRKDGEVDYSDKDIAALMMQQDEREWLELAGGIYQIAKGHTAIVVCPNSTVVADKLSYYIEGHAWDAGERGVAYSIHRSLGRKRSADLMNRYKAGEFPIAVSVRMFEKGFDYDRVNMVIMVRRTKSLRLYTQIAGRGTRPLVGIRRALSEEPDANKRMEIIANSEKPSCVIVDCVGIKDEAKNILGVIDILGRGIHDDTKERVRRMMLDRIRKQQEQEDQPEIEPMDVGNQARQAQREIREEWEVEREKRAAISVTVQVQYEVDNPRARKPRKSTSKMSTPTEAASAKQRGFIEYKGVSLSGIEISKKQASRMIGQLKKGMSAAEVQRTNRLHAKQAAPPKPVAPPAADFKTLLNQFRGH